MTNPKDGGAAFPTNDLTAIRAQMEALKGFTEGPWHDDLGETYRAKSADGMNIATANWVTLLGRLPSAEVKQNIGLIAAAPDMHATILALSDEMERMRAENDRLRAALKPFADEASYWFCHNYNREDRPVEGFKGYQPVMTCGDLFNARAALGQEGDA